MHRRAWRTKRCRSSGWSLERISMASRCNRSENEMMSSSAGAKFLAAGVCARPALDGLHEDISVCRGDVPNRASQREFSVAESPIHFARRDAANDLHSALVDFVEVVYEFSKIA